jgi:hypothetical protein
MKYQNFERFGREQRKSEFLFPYIPMKAKNSKMPFGSYSPSHHHPYRYASGFIQSSNTQQQQQQRPAESSDSWACDYCQVATFSTYEEAYHHEQVCSMNQNILSTNRGYHQCSREQQDDNKKVMPIAMPGDKDSLSDRQCYVRSRFVEIFCANSDDVSARHSKGAQKLHVGQIGIRCKHCANLPSKKRCERAVCYPSSVSRIYQTVADMQRFHFEICTAIPPEMKTLYKSLKTTRPRGMGSPQDYWITSAKELGLVDTDQGIRSTVLTNDANSDMRTQTVTPNTDEMPMMTPPVSPRNMSVSPRNISLSLSSSLPPLSPESQSTTQSSIPQEQSSDGSDCEMLDRDMEANMLLALRNPQTSKKPTRAG